MKYIITMLLASLLCLPAMAQDRNHVLSHAEVISTSQFSGASNHVTTGTARLLRHGRSHYVHLTGNFQFDGAPDPYLGFSKKGKLVSTSLFSKLMQNSGEQLYRLPNTFKLKDVDTLTLYCLKFSVPLGHAKL